MNLTLATTYQLYLGRNIPQMSTNLSVVSPDDIAEFLYNTVEQYFKDYVLSVGVGCWRDNPEDMYILTIITDQYEAGLQVRAIAKAYKETFNQEAVLVNSFRSDYILV